MKSRFFIIFLCLFVSSFLSAKIEKKIYDLKDDPLDVVIVIHPKDKKVLEPCIAGIRENCQNVRRIIVVSPEKLTDNAEWFDEKNYPFSYKDVGIEVANGCGKTVKEFFKNHNRGPGWYLQQLLKLYAAFVIPDISSNVLIVDGDVIFLRPVSFLNESNGGLFCTSRIEPKKHYIRHAKKLVPDYKRMNPDEYSVCHHMLFQRPILEDLFQTVENYQGEEFWKAFCHCVKFMREKNASEYEIYYSFALSHTDQVAIRHLRWTNSGKIKLKEKFRKQGYHFVGFHDYLEKKNIAEGKLGHE